MPLEQCKFIDEPEVNMQGNVFDNVYKILNERYQINKVDLYMSIEKWSTIAIEKWSIYSLVLSHEIVSSKRWLVGLDMSKI